MVIVMLEGKRHQITQAHLWVKHTSSAKMSNNCPTNLCALGWENQLTRETQRYDMISHDGFIGWTCPVPQFSYKSKTGRSILTGVGRSRAPNWKYVFSDIP